MFRAGLLLISGSYIECVVVVLSVLLSSYV
jgi:hypothetical protein